MHQMCWNIQLQYLIESDLEILESVKSGEKFSKHLSQYVNENGHHLTTAFNQSSLTLIFKYTFFYIFYVLTLCNVFTCFISTWFQMARSHDGHVVVCNHSLLGRKLTENVFIWVNLISNLKQKILQLQVFECFSVTVGGGLRSVKGSSADLPTSQVCGNLGKEQKCLLFFPPKDCS